MSVGTKIVAPIAEYGLDSDAVVDRIPGVLDPGCRRLGGTSYNAAHLDAKIFRGAIDRVGRATGFADRHLGRWADLIVDFGRELYVPWRIVEGQALYRDVAYFNGPLSPLFNALMFWCFGTSFRTLVWVNSVVLAAVSGLLLKNLAQRFSIGTATLTTVIFQLVLAYGHTFGIGNFNFLCPYSHEMTHGILLCLLMLTALVARNRPILRHLAVGVCWGLIFLGKPEFFLAASLMFFGSLLIRQVQRYSLRTA